MDAYRSPEGLRDGGNNGRNHCFFPVILFILFFATATQFFLDGITPLERLFENPYVGGGELWR